MNIRKSLMAGVVALTIAAGSSFAADGQGEHRRAAGKRMGARFAQALNLTDTQKEFSRQLREDTRKQAQPIMEELRKNRQELAAAVKSNNTGVIDTLSRRQAELRAQLTSLHAKAQASFYAQLTPEQKAKAEELRQQRKSRFSRGDKQQRG